MTGTNILSLRDLTISLSGSGARDIVKDISFDVPAGSVLGIVGGSGSGKTTLGLAMLGLLPAAMTWSKGDIVFDGHHIPGLSSGELRKLRGARMSMIFQESSSAFDPVMSIGEQIRETVLAHEDVSQRTARERTLAALRSAGINDPGRVAAAYSFELSGGLRQRAMIALAIVCRPALLIADEPTSSLDSMTRDKVLDLFKDLRRSLGLSIVFVTHDLGVVRRVADEVIVLHKGMIVERGGVAQVLSVPKADYTKALLEAEALS